MNNKTNELFCAISKLPVQKKYIDLRNIEINNSTDLVKVAYTFRNPIYETFRIIYMCDNEIVGYESTTSRMPNLCNVFNYKTTNMNGQDFTRGCVEMVNRMFRLGANGYYLMHNHPSGNAKASQPDIQLTKQLAKSVNGFLGHVIVDHSTFSWIDIKNGNVTVCDNLPIVSERKTTINEQCTKNPIMDYKINSRNDLARLMYDVKHSENYSLIILCSCTNKIRLIQEVPNCFMNMSYEQLGGYIKNQALMTGSTKAYITTTSKKAPFDSETFYNESQDLTSQSNEDITNTTTTFTDRADSNTTTFTNRADTNTTTFTNRTDTNTTNYNNVKNDINKSFNERKDENIKEFENRNDTSVKEYENRTDENTKSFIDREDITTHSRSGNIGVTTSQQMLESERMIANFKFVDIVARDIVKKIAILLY